MFNILQQVIWSSCLLVVIVSASQTGKNIAFLPLSLSFSLSPRCQQPYFASSSYYYYKFRGSQPKKRYPTPPKSELANQPNKLHQHSATDSLHHDERLGTPVLISMNKTFVCVEGEGR